MPANWHLFRRRDQLADSVRAAGKPWVITHGQMHAANIVDTRDDTLLLVDWDCVDPVAIELYRHIGLLWAICADTALFRSPHADNADTRHEWNNLQVALSTVDAWPS
ncbi:hypothetical protein GCM10027569_82090 [Flindersiella endophytica]